MRTLLLATLAAATALMLALASLTSPAAATGGTRPKPTCTIETYSDGSGVRYCGDRESGTYPPGTFTTPPAHTCTAAIVPFEDGSWTTGAMVYDGRVVDAHWAWRMPTYGWLPTYRSTPCLLVLAGVR